MSERNTYDNPGKTKQWHFDWHSSKPLAIVLDEATGSETQANAGAFRTKRGALFADSTCKKQKGRLYHKARSSAASIAVSKKAANVPNNTSIRPIPYKMVRAGTI
jgi:hypothetical protein